ncbi:hypothetical protein C7B79_00475 [Chroococcidiopsis cubana CCALA 043]|uniref:siphovirus Gp157 family protein n=1 Tax=Chroococcidiopsis cubana TaxID=171392 RepID=UPI000D078C77|nr:siphovirus Gp157 family protein [Chroococcidiopsis cubana]PSB66564.1 hypothetical protein C7B79_00475 [Chroococcidiopsis cubana CCALA 043]
MKQDKTINTDRVDTKPKDITERSLRELSLEAALLWNQIEDASESGAENVENLVKQLWQVQEATESKIDNIAWIVDYLKIEIDAAKKRLDAVIELHERFIARKEAQLAGIKQGLLWLHAQGLIPKRNIGKEREIEIRDNNPKVIPKVAADDTQLPDEFRVQELKSRLDLQAILDAHKSGRDISSFAEIQIGKQVRFKFQSSRTKIKHFQS